MNASPAATTVASQRPAGRALLDREPIPTRFLRALATPGGGVFLLVIALLIAVVVANPRYGDPEFLIRFVGRTAPIAVAAIGQYFVIVSGEFDLSMGAVVTAQVVLAGYLIGSDTSRIPFALLVMTGLAILVGLVNGLATTLLKVPSFIVTLGTMLALSGLILFQTGGAATGNPADSFRQIGRGTIQNVPVIGVLPYPVIILTALCVAAVALMRRPFGRILIAVGDNPEAASLSGASLVWVKTRAFLLSSFCATIAGILLVGYAGVHPNVGQGYEFTAITAVVLGGVVLGGGRGWVMSAVAGAFALELMFTLFNALGVAATWRPTVQGVIIILAVALAGRAWRAGRRPARPGEPNTPAGEHPDTPDGSPPAPAHSPNPPTADPATHTGGQ